MTKIDLVISKRNLIISLPSYIDYQNEIGIILIIEMAKKELIGGYIGFMLIIEMAKIELIGGHIGFNVLI